MNSPHFFLRCESSQLAADGPAGGRWRFVLEPVEGGERFEAADDEPLAQGERLELLAAVRGLESLDQPSRVTLSTASRFVYHGVVQGLNAWRASGFQWECYGELVPIKHCDLWRRMAHALSIHQVECRLRGRLTPRRELTEQNADDHDQTPPDSPITGATRSRRRWRIDAPHTTTSSPNPKPRRRRRATPAAATAREGAANPLASAWTAVSRLWQSCWPEPVGRAVSPS